MSNVTMLSAPVVSSNRGGFEIPRSPYDLAYLRIGAAGRRAMEEWYAYTACSTVLHLSNSLGDRRVAPDPDEDKGEVIRVLRFLIERANQLVAIRARSGATARRLAAPVSLGTDVFLSTFAKQFASVGGDEALFLLGRLRDMWAAFGTNGLGRHLSFADAVVAEGDPR